MYLALLSWLEDLDKHGFVLVRNVPIKQGPVHELQVLTYYLASRGSIFEEIGVWQKTCPRKKSLKENSLKPSQDICM